MKCVRALIATTACGGTLVACTSILGDFSSGTGAADDGSTDSAAEAAGDGGTTDSSALNDASNEDANATDASDASDASDAGPGTDAGQCSGADGGVVVVLGTPPLDAVPGARAAFGLRKLRGKYSGPLVRIVRASDGMSEDVSPNTTGDFPVVAVTSWAMGSKLTVATWYDQTGNGHDVTQMSPTARPTMSLVSTKNRTTVDFTFANSTYLTGDFPWISGNSAWSSETTILGGVMSQADYQPIFAYGSTQPNESIFLLTQVSGVFDFGYGPYGTNVDSKIATTAPATFTMRYDGMNAVGNVNGASFSSAAGSVQNISTTTFVIGGSPTQVDIWLNGSLADIILYPTAISECDARVLQSLSRSYHSF